MTDEEKKSYERQIEHLRKCLEVATDACESDKRTLIKELAAQRKYIEQLEEQLKELRDLGK